MNQKDKEILIDYVNQISELSAGLMKLSDSMVKKSFENLNLSDEKDIEKFKNLAETFNKSDLPEKIKQAKSALDELKKFK